MDSYENDKPDTTNTTTEMAVNINKTVQIPNMMAVSL